MTSEPTVMSLVDGAAEARRELWRRHDEGAIDADELEARLLAVDAATTPDAITDATGGPVSIRRRLGSSRARRRLVAGAVALAVLAAGTGVVVAASAWDGGSGASGSREVRVVGGRPPPLPVPIPPATGVGAVIVDPAIPLPTLAPGDTPKCDPATAAATDLPANATRTTIPICE